MNSAPSALILLLAATLLPACSVLTDKSPPKTEAEGHAKQTVPDTLRDPRPEMPPVGPLGKPMH